jgi:hypothetical protein
VSEILLEEFAEFAERPSPDVPSDSEDVPALHALQHADLAAGCLSLQLLHLVSRLLEGRDLRLYRKQLAELARLSRGIADRIGDELPCVDDRLRALGAFEEDDA